LGLTISVNNIHHLLTRFEGTAGQQGLDSLLGC
jgi:hypothetical protein